MVFEDTDVQYSLMDKERLALAEKNEFIQTAKCMSEIEKQNIRMVQVLQQVGQTSKDIKLSDAYAQIKIDKELGRKGDNDGGDYPGFMNDDIMTDERFEENQAYL